MNLAIVIVISAALALAVILSVAVNRSLQVKGIAGTKVAIRPIDIEAFRNLIDPTRSFARCVVSACALWLPMFMSRITTRLCWLALAKPLLPAAIRRWLKPRGNW
jgi:hypothetical protein